MSKNLTNQHFRTKRMLETRQLGLFNERYHMDKISDNLISFSAVLKWEAIYLNLLKISIRQMARIRV